MGRFHHHADGSEREHDHRDVGDHSGYSDTGTERVTVLETILAENDRIAHRNRSDFLDAGVTTVNLMSSPGAGKTTLLKRTITRLSGQLRLGILEGDIATDLDAHELEGLGAPVSLVNTSAGFGGECHLDATMVRSGLGRLPLGELDMLIIENVGNLVCPAEFDVGQHSCAMVYAITEGEEKPLKYPGMFRACDVVVINKIDLLPHLDFDLSLFLDNVQAVNPKARLIEVSARTGDGMDEWCGWLRETQGGESGQEPVSRVSGLGAVPHRGWPRGFRSRQRVGGEERPHSGVGINGVRLGSEHIGDGFWKMRPAGPLVALTDDAV
jgi:hydrogenase nickel incorporation protein HypB